VYPLSNIIVSPSIIYTLAKHIKIFLLKNRYISQLLNLIELDLNQNSALGSIAKNHNIGAKINFTVKNIQKKNR
jgi:hypothetical protein